MGSDSLFLWLAVVVASLSAAVVWYVMRIDPSKRPRWLEWLLIWPLLFRDLEKLDSEKQRRSSRRITWGFALMFGLIIFALLFTGGPKNVVP